MISGIFTTAICTSPLTRAWPGAYLVSCLYEQLTKRGIEVRVSTEATRLLTNEKGSIKGVVVTGPNGEYTVDCTAVILATGGFGSNFDMVVENDPSLKGIHMGNFAGSTGDGIKMAQELGAQTCNMNLYKINNKASLGNIAYSIPSAAISAGAIYINKDGQRFCNEGKTDTKTLLAQKDAEYFAIYNDAIYKELEAKQNELGWYDYYPFHYYMEQSDAILKADTLEELAGKMKVDVAALKETVDGLAKETYESDAAKQGAAKWAKGPYYASQQTVGINHTLGGLVIDASGRVYNQEKLPIFGLYAGGEVVGNVQGGDYYFGLIDAAVMGGVCGENAVYYVMDHTGLTEHVLVEHNAAVVPEVTGNFVDGVYTGEGAGNGGTIKLEVVVKDKSITEVKILEQAETANIFSAVLNASIPSIIRTQNLEIDACSGATVSCNGVREALKAALA
ncbi:MAG: FAD-binding protein [Oscillospiraceae bacterium]